MKIRNVVFARCCHIEWLSHPVIISEINVTVFHFLIQLLAVQFNKSSKRCGAHIPHLKANVLLCTECYIQYTFVFGVFATFQPNTGAKMFISDGKEKCKQAGNTHIHTPFLKFQSCSLWERETLSQSLSLIDFGSVSGPVVKCWCSAFRREKMINIQRNYRSLLSLHALRAAVVVLWPLCLAAVHLLQHDALVPMQSLRWSTQRSHSEWGCAYVCVFQNRQTKLMLLVL